MRCSVPILAGRLPYGCRIGGLAGARYARPRIAIRHGIPLLPQPHIRAAESQLHTTIWASGLPIRWDCLRRCWLGPGFRKGEQDVQGISKRAAHFCRVWDPS